MIDAIAMVSVVDVHNGESCVIWMECYGISCFSLVLFQFLEFASIVNNCFVLTPYGDEFASKRVGDTHDIITNLSLLQLREVGVINKFDGHIVHTNRERFAIR